MPSPRVHEQLDPARREGFYQGSSASGSLEEAVGDAISKAKTGLGSTLVRWRLVELHGENGGVAQVNVISVTIRAWVV